MSLETYFQIINLPPKMANSKLLKVREIFSEVREKSGNSQGILNGPRRGHPDNGVGEGYKTPALAQGLSYLYLN